MFEFTPSTPDTTVNDHQNDHSWGCGTLSHTSLGWDRASGSALAADRARKGGSPTVKQVVRALAR
jgi:hypothetical protein